VPRSAARIVQRRVCLISDCLAQPFDEGARVLARGLAEGLRTCCEVLALGTHPRAAPGSCGDWLPDSGAAASAAREFRPDFLLVFPHASNTVPALLRSRLLARRSGVRRFAFLAYQPRPHGLVGRRLQRWLAPELTLCLSAESERRFREEGVAAERILCGLDLARFTPATPEEKRRLREQHGFAPDQRLALHVGHAKPGRNLEVMIEACRRADWTGVFVLSTFDAADAQVLRQLDDAGFRVVDGADAVIEEWYRLADCYVFPVRDPLACAEVPMSVLEALACGLPVVASRFGGLPDLLPSCERLTYADTDVAFAECLLALEGSAARRPAQIEQLGRDRVAAEVLRVLEAHCT